ncbi:MAG: S-layer homology domain-containing protein [Armatimonadota bacterium]
MSVWRPLFLCVLLVLSLAALPSLAAAPFQLTLAGELAYGVPHDVAITADGHYAYIAAQGAVSVLDISVRAHPVQIVKIDTPGSAEGVAISGNYLYVADWDSGLRIINIAIPTQPLEVGNYDTPGFAYGVAVSADGNYAYVADHAAGLEVIDISTKSDPTLAGRLDTPGYAWAVALSGNYAFVADGFAGLLAVDVSVPASPTAAASSPAVDRVMDVAVMGSYAYVADGTAGMRVVDISDPSTSLPGVGSIVLSGRASGVFVQGTLAYVAAGTAGLQVVDISNPADPAFVDSFDTAGNAVGVAAYGTAAYVADDSGGLRVVEVGANPAPVIVGTAATVGNAESVAAQDEVAYIADGDGGLRAFDVSAPTAPQLLWECDSALEAMDVAVQGDYAYVADWNGSLRVVGIATPSGVVCDVGSCAISGHPNGVAVGGALAYVAAGDAGLALVDIGSPSSPGLLEMINTPGSANGVAVAGSYAYVADGNAGLQILRCTSPTGPVGSAETAGYSWDVGIAGSYAYLASGDAGLEVFNIADPANPAKVAGLPLAGSAHSVALKENYAFVSVGGRGVVVVNVANPLAPAVVSSCGTPSVPGPSDLAIAGGYAYVADAESGLVVVDIVSPYIGLATLESPAYGQRLALLKPSDGSGVGYIAAGPSGLLVAQVTEAEEAGNPALARSNRALGEVTDVALSGSYAYVTDASGRLSVLNLGSPTNPYTVGIAQTSGSALGVAAATVGSSGYALVAGGYQGLSTVATSVVGSPNERTVTDTPGWCSDVTSATLAGSPFALVADGDAGLRLLNLSPLGTAPVVVLNEGFETASSLNNWVQWPVAEWNALSPRRGLGSVRLRNNGSITRVVPTVDYRQLSGWCYLAVTGLDSVAEYILAEWSSDGGASWQALAQITYGDPEADGLLHKFSFDLPAAAEDNAQFALRFSIHGDDANDYGYVDDVVIQSESSSQPNEVGYYNTPGQAVGVATSISALGTYALVADGEAGVRIVDVSSPASPVEVGHYDTAGYAEAVATFGTVAAVADGDDGVVLLDFHIPTAPVEVAYFDTPGWASDVKVMSDHAWVADTGWGLSVFQLWHSFRDIIFGFWAFFEVEEATTLDNIIHNKVTVGYPDGKYHPEIACSRDQMSVFIARAMNWVQWDEDLTATEDLFVDVRTGYWAGKAIEECINHDVVTGYADGLFRPTRTVRRDDMCVFIARAKGWINIDDPMNTAPQLFPDVAAGYWAGTAIEACIQHGIVKGYPDGTYRPYLDVTRDQMAVFIWRAFLQ